jgi:choice-of-anchor A domain-containing protein
MNKLTSRLSMVFLCLLFTGFGAEASTLGTAGYYNEFIFGNIFQEGTDSQGRVATGGSATYADMSVASKIQVRDPQHPELVVAGNLVWANGSVGYFPEINSGSPEYKKGDIVVGGSAYIAQNNGGSSVAYGSLTTGATLPFSFAVEQSYLQGMSTYWGQLAATGNTSIKPGEIFLTGADPYLNVFTLSASDIQPNIGFNINVPEGSTTLVNVSGAFGKMENFGFYFNGKDGNLDGDDLNNDGQPDFLFPDSLILYNFFEATALSIAGIEVHGSILAPWADALFSNGHIEGNLIARSLVGTGEAHNELFNGRLPGHPVPEPATVLLLGGGLIGAAALRRRLKD